MYQPHIWIDQAVQPQECIVLDENKSHHLAQVLRMKEGDTLTLFNPTGHTYSAKIKEIHKKKTQIFVECKLDRLTESPCKIHLIHGLCRFDKMDMIVQKATELGVSAIHPCLMTHSDIHAKGERALKKQQHWHRIAIAACEQAKRQHIPHIAPIQKLAELIPNLPPKSTVCVLDPYCDHGQWPTPPQDEIFLIIGPEGGLSQEELSLLQQYGAHQVKLGPRVLRTETAAITATSLAQYHYGDLRLGSPN